MGRTCTLLAWLSAAPLVWPQAASLRGRVTDESGAVIPGARVTLSGPAGFKKTSTTDAIGTYSFTGLPSGVYVVDATAPKLTLAQPATITLGAGAETLDLRLQVAIEPEKVTVQEDTKPVVSTEPARNATALVLRGSDLDALADNPEDLMADLQALAGPSAGPGGGALFVDGFSGGQLPSKDSIREVRINQNPFSPEYDRLGYGRIEILTKAGTGKFRGSVYHNFAHHFWNSRNPYAQRKAPFELNESGGSASGPLSKRSSFFLEARRDGIDNGSIVNAITLDPATLAVVDPFTDTPRTPQRRVGVNPRVDYQLDERNNLTVRYGFTHSDIRDSGIGSFNLVSRGVHSTSTNQNVQVTETAVLGSAAINETRFQVFRTTAETIPNTAGAALQVLGSFNGGGAPSGHQFDTRTNYELQNYTTVMRRAHFWRFGVRLRRERLDNVSPQNFGGTFTFSGGPAPVLGADSKPVLDSSGQVVLEQITSIERYRRTLLLAGLGFSAAQIRVSGGGATQFTLGAGTPDLAASQMDVGLFVGDDWRVRSNVTLSLGLRWETQNHMRDRMDFAPRVGVAWAPGAGNKNRRPATVIRAGVGIFYDRFSLSNTLTALRYNGVVQQQYVVTNPDFFPAVPATSTLDPSRQTIQEVSPGLRAPYFVQSAVSVERQLPRNTTVAITYANSHGLHLLRSQDRNAPLPGTYDPRVPPSGVFPLGKPGAVFVMESAGLYNQHQLIANVNARIHKDVSLSGGYVLNRALANTDGLSTFPAKPYDAIGEYGPAATDVRHRFSLTGSLATKWNVRLSPFVVVESGPPFDVTVGRDLFGTTLFNGRPGIASDASKPGVVRTAYGLLDPNPAAGDRTLGRNAGRGPGSMMVNLRVAKIIEFGAPREGPAAPQRGPGGGDTRGAVGGVFTSAGGTASSGSSAGRRYNLNISLSIRNLLNHTNPGPIIGNITSPLFGRANQPAGSGLGGGGFSEAANNRRLELQMRLGF